MEPFRVGFGYDVHELAEGRPFVLGGITIPHDRGLAGHSDADVLIHAIIDALLGAAGLGDIGRHFPDTDPAYRRIDSRLLLEKTIAQVRNAGYELSNIDATVCLQQPKIAGIIPAMKEELARVLQVATGQVSVKATTTEKLGFVGREEGVAAYAVALIFKKKLITS